MTGNLFAKLDLNQLMSISKYPRAEALVYQVQTNSTKQIKSINNKPSTKQIKIKSMKNKLEINKNLVLL